MRTTWGKVLKQSVPVIVGAICCSISAAQGQADLPAVRALEANVVSPANAYTTISGYASPTFDPAHVSSEVQRFSDIYEGDWNEICAFAQNNIRYLPNFGLLKGGTGALQSGEGTSFDQAQLVVQSFRLSGGTARYRYGRVVIQGELVEDLTGIDTSEPGASQQIEDWFAYAGTPVTVSGSTSIEIVHLWAEGLVNGTWETCDPSLQSLSLLDPIDIPGASQFDGAAFEITALTGASYGTNAGIEWAQSVNTAGIELALKTSAQNFVNGIDALYGEAIPALEEIIGGQIQEYSDEIIAQDNITVAQSGTWAQEIPIELKASVRIYGFGGFDHTIYADEISNERFTLRWVANDGEMFDVEDEGTTDPTSGHFQLLSGHRSLNEIESPRAQPNASAATSPYGEFLVYRSPDQAAVSPYSSPNYEISIDIDLPYMVDDYDRSGTDAVRKWVTRTSQQELVLSFAGMSAAEYRSYEFPARQNRDRYEAITPLPSIGVEEGTGGGSGTLHWVSYAYPNKYYWVHGWSQKFDQKTDKDFIWRLWASEVSKLSDVLEGLTQSKIITHYHVGVAGADGKGQFPPPGTVLGGGRIWLDIESGVSVIGSGSTSAGSDAIMRTLATFMSALENAAINQTLLWDRDDWDSYAENDLVDVLDSLRVDSGSILAFSNIAESGNYGKLLKFNSSNFSAAQLTDYPLETTTFLSQFLAADPARELTLPEIWPIGSSHLVPVFSDAPNESSILIGERAAFAAKGAVFKKGAGESLTDIGTADHVRNLTEGGGFTAGVSLDPKSGDWAFTAPADLRIGNGGEPFELAFRRSFSANGLSEAPLPPGWSHNWELFAEESSSMSQLTRPGNPRALGLTVSSLQAVLEMYSTDVSPERLLTVSTAMRLWVGEAKLNSVSIPDAGVFARLPDGSFVAPPIAGMEAARLSFSGGDYTYTSPGQQTVLYRKLRPTDFCFPDDEANCTFQPFINGEGGYGGRAPSDITRRYYAITQTFPYGFAIHLEYNSNTGTLKRVWNDFGREISFEYRASTACKYLSQDQHCQNYREWYDELVAITDSAGNRVEFHVELATPPFGIVVRHSQSGLNATDPAKYYSTTSTSHNADADYYGIGSTYEYYGENSTVVPKVSVAFRALESGRNQRTVDKVADGEGNVWQIMAGVGRSVVQNPSPDDGRLTRRFDQRGNLVREISPSGVVARRKHDLRGRVVEVQNALVSDDPKFYRSRTTFTYDAFSNVVTETVHTRTPYSTGADAFKSFAEIYPGDLDYAPLVTTRTYDVSGPNRYVGNILTETDAAGAVTTYSYNSAGLLTLTAGPSGEETSSTYTSSGKTNTTTTKITASESVTTKYSYNVIGNLVGVTEDDGGLSLTSILGYNSAGDLTSIRDPKGNVTSADYDGQRRQVSIHDALGGGADYVRDFEGRLIRTERLKQDGSYAVSQFSYNHNDRPVSLTEPTGDTTVFQYNGSNRLSQTTDADGLISGYEYYPGGQLYRVVRGVGTPLEQVEVENTYDWAGNLARLRPARGVKQNTSIYDTVWTRDPYGRANAGMTYADGSEVKNWFDAVGRIEKTMTRQILASPTADYDYVTNAYDNSGRPVQTVQRDRHYANQMREERKIDYDLAGRITREYELGDDGVFTQGVDEEVIYDYDLLGRVLSETSNGRTVSYGYDDAGNRTSITWPDNAVATYTYDALNRLDTVRYNGQLLADYDYDLRSRLVYAAMGNGTTANLDHEDDDDFTALYYAFSGETQGFAYGYTGAGRLNSKGYSDPAMAWTPPANSELFSYASLTLPGEAANVLDQYEAIVRPADTLDLDYDQRGNLTDISGGAQARTYTYTLDNRMESAQVGALNILYDYDVIGRRVGKDVGGQETRYLHAGDMEIAEYDSTGTLLRRYIPGGVIDARVAWVEVAGDGSETLEYYHADRQGSVIAMSDGAGTVSDRYAYDPYGNEMAGASQGGNLFRYTGRKYDPETGLYYYRARYYDPEMGRFLQTDPIGYKDQINMYAYVGGDPLNATDPTGQEGCRLDDPICRLKKIVVTEKRKHTQKKQTNFILRLLGGLQQRGKVEARKAGEEGVVCYALARNPLIRANTEVEAVVARQWLGIKFHTGKAKDGTPYLGFGWAVGGGASVSYVGVLSNRETAKDFQGLSFDFDIDDPQGVSNRFNSGNPFKGVHPSFGLNISPFSKPENIGAFEAGPEKGAGITGAAVYTYGCSERE